MLIEPHIHLRILGSPNTRVGAGALLLNGDNRVLLFQRPVGAKFDGGQWTQPGGRLYYAETPEAAARRWLRDTVGISANELSLLTVHSHVSVNGDPPEELHWVSVCYLCTSFTGEPVVKEDDVVCRWDWFELTALPSPLTSYTLDSIRAMIGRIRRGC